MLLHACRCLQDHLQEGNFTTGCTDEVQRYEQTASTDYRCCWFSKFMITCNMAQRCRKCLLLVSHSFTSLQHVCCYACCTASWEYVAFQYRLLRWVTASTAQPSIAQHSIAQPSTACDQLSMTRHSTSMIVQASTTPRGYVHLVSMYIMTGSAACPLPPAVVTAA